MTKASNKVKDVPFYGQDWDVSKWKEMGFDSKKDAAYWKESSCAVLCLKMAIEQLQPSKIKGSIFDLIKEGVELNSYTHKYGWDHNGIANLARNHGLSAVVKSKVSNIAIKEYLEQGAMIIVSIKWGFQNKKSLKERILFWKKYGGHMALVIGHDEDEFIVNHTSIRPEYNWRNRLVPCKEFEEGFTGRCIVLRNQ